MLQFGDVESKEECMRILAALLIVSAVCLFFFLVGRKGDIKGGCNSCINCPIKDCAERKDAIEE